jgi:hypothetical protein
MKIIQLLAAIDGESPGTIGSQIYGLGDDGVVYELVSPRKPYAQGSGYIPDDVAEKRLAEGKSVLFYQGSTGGWKEICRSDERSEVIKHPLAP